MSDALREALAGHHGRLNAKIDKALNLTPEERDYIIERLQSFDRRRGKAKMKAAFDGMISDRVSVLTESKGTETAVRDVAKELGVGRSTIYKALADTEDRLNPTRIKKSARRVVTLPDGQVRINRETSD